MTREGWFRATRILFCRRSLLRVDSPKVFKTTMLRGCSSSYLAILPPALVALQKPRVHVWEEDTRYVMQKKDRASCSWCAGGGRGIDPRRACTQCGHSLFFPGSGAWYLLLLLHSHIISTCPLPTSCHPLGPRPLRNRYSDLSSLSSRFQG